MSKVHSMKLVTYSPLRQDHEYTFEEMYPRDLWIHEPFWTGLKLASQALMTHRAFTKFLKRGSFDVPGVWRISWQVKGLYVHYHLERIG